MITFTKLGRHGRLGNQLFQIAATIGIARKNKDEYVFPNWQYSKYFKKPHRVHTGLIKPTLIYNEPHFHYKEVDLGPRYLNDLFGYFQSEKYWSEAVQEVKDQFQFTDEFKLSASTKFLSYNQVEVLKGEVIAISIRRGDYVNNPAYAQLSVTWYYKALETHFPKWKTDNTIIIFSDDIEYCKLHFGNYENVLYASNTFNNNDKSKYWDENKSAVEQLCLMSMCDHFIIANSTFSWWGAYLGEKAHSKVIRPEELFAGKMKANNNIKDHYPERWIIHSDDRIDLSDVTFMIPVCFDHSDRLENMALNVCMLQRSFKTNIIVGENFSDRFRKYENYGCIYKKFNYSAFHRTRMLNEMAKMSSTPIVANWDADVFISPLQILQSVESIRNGTDMIFPYDGRFARVPRMPYFKLLEKTLDVGMFGNKLFKGMMADDRLSVGGAIFFNKESFFHGGGENENFVSYGPEDVERDLRFRRLGYKVERTTGPLYHLDHWRGPDSKSHNKFHKRNHEELDLIDSFKTELALYEYTQTWPWVKQFNKK